MPLTPTLANNTCHASIAAAVDSYYSAVPIATSVTGLTSYTLEYISVAGVWYLQKTTYSNNGNVNINFTVPVVAPTFPDCDLTAPYFDGMAMGWGVVGAMAAALSVIFIKKSLFQR